MDSERGMNISALAHRTGVAADTLRKWEQRYGILKPRRTEGGQRRYGEADVARVEWLRDRLAEGWRVGEAAALLGGGDAAPAATADELVDLLYGAAREADASAITRGLDQAFALLPLEAACEDVVAPLLHRIGEGWASGELSVADEHLVSEAVRGRLSGRLTVTRGGVNGSAVLACAPGERHELGLLVVATLMRASGWHVVYLGADVPPRDALAFAERVGARVLALSVTLEEHVPALLAGYGDAQRDGLEIAVGGRAATPKLARSLRARHALSAATVAA